MFFLKNIYTFLKTQDYDHTYYDTDRVYCGDQTNIDDVGASSWTKFMFCYYFSLKLCFHFLFKVPLTIALSKTKHRSGPFMLVIIIFLNFFADISSFKTYNLILMSFSMAMALTRHLKCQVSRCQSELVVFVRLFLNAF